jgi:hypothetical protein
VQKGWLKHVPFYLNKPIDPPITRLTCFLQAHSSIRKEYPGWTAISGITSGNKPFG